MMDTLIGFRIPAAVVQRLDALAEATGRNRSQIARYFLSKACSEGLPAAWLEGVEAQRIATGRGTRGAP
jgi:predicted transcriptional regulator